MDADEVGLDREPIVAPTAFKHGIEPEDALHAFHHPMRAWDMGDGFVMLIGGDTAGNLLEIGYVEGDRAPVIIHAMRARDKFLR
ncbi:MAG: hypothetical protein SPK50_04295 [Mobiluncus porci]|uniref:hypothetical protein n=1 Tax=Mobiluncus TaxID=2050 RepID=UPI0023F57634|nr:MULTISPECIES: hypothetical protein [Mobiluncus]MCI6583717.1 hypothetical protein [Mobiluncus sp.]MDD7540775.1 hypothetical protein [Mobiluncus porci]MDY5748337.1 hypothetical protein [Mobiluncus porci]